MDEVGFCIVLLLFIITSPWPQLESSNLGLSPNCHLFYPIINIVMVLSYTFHHNWYDIHVYHIICPFLQIGQNLQYNTALLSVLNTSYHHFNPDKPKSLFEFCGIEALKPLPRPYSALQVSHKSHYISRTTLHYSTFIDHLKVYVYILSWKVPIEE